MYSLHRKPNLKYCSYLTSLDASYFYLSSTTRITSTSVSDFNNQFSMETAKPTAAG